MSPDLERDYSQTAGRAPTLIMKRELPAQWQPDADGFKTVQNLAELGWPPPLIAKEIGVSGQKFVALCEEYPDLKLALATGAEENKGLAERLRGWYPKPADLERIKDLASDGLTEDAIAAEMSISRVAFRARMADNPLVKDAFEQGNGEYQAQLLRDFKRDVDTASPDLKFTAAARIFLLKSVAKLSDRPDLEPKQIVEVKGSVEHRHTLNAPAPVAIEDLANFAEQEMARAKEVARLKLQDSPQLDTVDAEVSEPTA